MLCEDLDRPCPRENGDVFRCLYGREDEARPGDRNVGDVGSVDLRRFAGLSGDSPCRLLFVSKMLCSLKIGKGVLLNASIFSVSGTGSIV